MAIEKKLEGSKILMISGERKSFFSFLGFSFWGAKNPLHFICVPSLWWVRSPKLFQCVFEPHRISRLGQKKVDSESKAINLLLDLILVQAVEKIGFRDFGGPWWAHNFFLFLGENGL